MKNFLKLFIIEWKYNGWIFFLGITALLIDVIFVKYFKNPYGSIANSINMSVWFFPILIGTRLFTEENIQGKRSFLTALPVSKAEIWVSKLIYGIIQVIIIIGIYIMINHKDYANQFPSGSQDLLMFSVAIFIFINAVLVSVIFKKFFVSLLGCSLFSVIFGYGFFAGFFVFSGIREFNSMYFKYYRYFGKNKDYMAILRLEIQNFQKLALENATLISVFLIVIIAYISLELFRRQKGE